MRLYGSVCVCVRATVCAGMCVSVHVRMCVSVCRCVPACPCACVCARASAQGRSHGRASKGGPAGRAVPAGGRAGGCVYTHLGTYLNPVISMLSRVDTTFPQNCCPFAPALADLSPTLSLNPITLPVLYKPLTRNFRTTLMYLSIDLPICLSTYLSIYLSIYLPKTIIC